MSSSPHSETANVLPIDVLVAFLTNSKFTRSLRFVNSHLIDNSLLVRVLQNLQMIREINLSGCNWLSDSTLIKLVQQCPSLYFWVLHMDGGCQVTKSSLLRAIQNCG
jgi:hypothetical protein